MPEVPTISEASVESFKVQALLNDQKEEILAFLSTRPIHTVCMASYIRNNGVVSPLNRGVFYGCRDAEGVLQGVALIGHATLVETQNDNALKAFALLKHQCPGSHLVRGERQMIERFWTHLAALGHKIRLAYQELLFEVHTPPQIDGPAPELRTATLDDLEQILEINAGMIFSECGIDPFKRDPIGFRERLARRIEQDQVWVWMKDGQLVFKADVFAETPEMVYLEGVNVNEHERGKHHGLRCMAELSRILLERSKSICLLVNERSEKLSAFYTKAGYQFRGVYETIYLHPHSD
jgi:hypothetical protein